MMMAAPPVESKRSRKQGSKEAMALDKRVSGLQESLRP